MKPEKKNKQQNQHPEYNTHKKSQCTKYFKTKIDKMN